MHRRVQVVVIGRIAHIGTGRRAEIAAERDKRRVWILEFSNPRVLHNALDVETTSRVDAQTSRDQVFGAHADGVPRLHVVLEGGEVALANFLAKRSTIFAFKGKVSRRTPAPWKGLD